jgi:hypothetical protein
VELGGGIEGRKGANPKQINTALVSGGQSGKLTILIVVLID